MTDLQAAYIAASVSAALCSSFDNAEINAFIAGIKDLEYITPPIKPCQKICE